MKNLVKVLSVLLVFGVAVASCQKDDDITNLEAKKGQVSFNMQSTAVPCGMQKSSAIERPESFPVFVNQMTITATAAAGVVSKDFQFADEGEGEMAMSPYLGTNNFHAVTHVETPVYPNWLGSAEDGFGVSGFYPVSDHNILYYVNKLRAISPYIVFTGGVNNQLITEAPSTVDMNMTTLNGRLIASFSFEVSDNDPNMVGYSAKIAMTTDGGDETYAISLDGYDLASDNYDCGMMYLSNERCVAGKKVDVTIKIYEGTSLLKTITLTGENADKFKILPGKDRLVKVVIGKSTVSVSDVSFNFTWDWDTQDDDITIE